MRLNGPSMQSKGNGNGMLTLHTDQLSRYFVVLRIVSIVKLLIDIENFRRRNY